MPSRAPVPEETGLTLTSWRLRGIVTFSLEGYGTEYMFLYTAEGFLGVLGDCSEGELNHSPPFAAAVWESCSDTPTLRAGTIGHQRIYSLAYESAWYTYLRAGQLCDGGK